jgi:hypothetical protein
MSSCPHKLSWVAAGVSIAPLGLRETGADLFHGLMPVANDSRRYAEEPRRLLP